MQNGPSSESPPWLEHIDHTADVGIVVRATDLKQLFERAAWGMFSVITDLTAVRPTTPVSIPVVGTDRQALLVRWLSELNFRHVTQHLLFSRFALERLTDTELAATVSGEAIDPARHVIYTEIKAVTFHGLQIGAVDDGWKAQIIFDL
jgi:SHS2 domain-containing protein